MVVCRVRHRNCLANGESFASQTLQCINYWSLACKVGKRGGLEKDGQDMKILINKIFREKVNF